MLPALGAADRWKGCKQKIKIKRFWNQVVPILMDTRTWVRLVISGKHVFHCSIRQSFMLQRWIVLTVPSWKQLVKLVYFSWHSDASVRCSVDHLNINHDCWQQTQLPGFGAFCHRQLETRMAAFCMQTCVYGSISNLLKSLSNLHVTDAVEWWECRSLCSQHDKSTWLLDPGDQQLAGGNS